MTSLFQSKEMLDAKQNHEEEFHQSYHKKKPAWEVFNSFEIAPLSWPSCKISY